jgi:hypothetical protein
VLSNLTVMPSFYSPTYYEDQKKEHDFYINLGNQCRISEEKRQAWRKVQLEEQILQGYKRKLDEAKKVLEENKKLKHALWEYNYTKDKELVLFTNRIAWRDSSPLKKKHVIENILSKILAPAKLK